jgi:hypothetical protein
LKVNMFFQARRLPVRDVYNVMLSKLPLSLGRSKICLQHDVLL